MRARERLVGVLFFVSGAAGLLYEVVWSRLLKDVFGVTAYAIAAVLAAYLAGLAIGSWFFGRRADPSRNPLRLYALLEIGAGLTALLGTVALPLLDAVHVRAATRFAPDSATLACVRLLLASVVILPPTILMGGTLPVITRAVAAALGRLGSDLGWLYALNTAGAVAGSVVAGFLLIRVLGQRRTLWLAAAIDLAVGAGALLLARGATAPSPPAAAVAARLRRSSGLLVAVAASGVASLALEVLWTRVLVLVVGSSTHAFVTMVSTFLTGIALGSFLARPFLDRVADPRRIFGWVQAGIAASTLAAIPLIGRLVAAGQEWMLRIEGQWLLLTLARFGLAFLVLLVPTTLIGMSFPLAAKVHVRDMGALGRELGVVYGANTAGNIAGAIAGGFVLLPLFGLQRGIVLATAFNLGSALWALFPARAELAAPRSWMRAAPALAASLACAALVGIWRPAPFVSIEEGPQDKVVYYQEGLVSTVKVIRRADDARQLVMLVDGVRIGQSHGGIDYKQQALAHLPFLLLGKGKVQKALTIGLGSGVLAGEVVLHPGVQRLDCVELSGSVIEGARWFADWNGNVLQNPAVNVIADDGINFLKRRGDRYDAIISDAKSRIGQAGNAPFYSADFYRSARDHLSADALFIQWTPLEEVPEDLRTILRTFRSVFPHSYLWFGHGSLFLVGLTRPLALDLDHVQEVLDAPETADLRRYEWRNAAEVPALLVADPGAIAGLVSGESTINSFDHPVLEFYSPRELARPAAARVAANALALSAARRETMQHIRLAGPDAAVFEADSRAVGLLLDALRTMADPSQSSTAAALLQRAAAESRDATVVRFSASNALLDIGIDLDGRGDPAAAADSYRAALEAWPGNALAHLNLAIVMANEGDNAKAAEELRRTLLANPESSKAHALLARLVRTDDPEAAISHFRAALRLSPQLADVHDDLAETLAAAGQTEEALREFREAMRLQPGWVAPLAGAALLLAVAPDTRLRDPAQAVRLARRALDLAGSRSDGVLEVLAAAYAAAGRYEDAVATQRKAVDVLSGSGNENALAAAQDALERYRRNLGGR